MRKILMLTLCVITIMSIMSVSIAADYTLAKKSGDDPVNEWAPFAKELVLEAIDPDDPGPPAEGTKIGPIADWGLTSTIPGMNKGRAAIEGNRLQQKYWCSITAIGNYQILATCRTHWDVDFGGGDRREWVGKTGDKAWNITAK